MSRLPPPVSIPLNSLYADMFHPLMFEFQRAFLKLKGEKRLESAQPHTMVKVFDEALEACQRDHPNVTLDVAERACEVYNLYPSIADVTSVEAYCEKLKKYMEQRDQKLSEFHELFSDNRDRIQQVAKEEGLLSSRMSVNDVHQMEADFQASVPDGYRQLFLKCGSDEFPLYPPHALAPWSWHLPVCIGDQPSAESPTDVEIKAEYTSSWKWPTNVVTDEELDNAYSSPHRSVGEGGIVLSLLKEVHPGLDPFLVARGPQRGQLWVMDSNFDPCVIAPLKGEYAKIFVSTKQFQFLKPLTDRDEPISILDFYLAMIEDFCSSES